MIHQQLSAVRIKSVVDIAAVIIVEAELRRVRGRRHARRRRQQLDRHFWTSDHRATLIRPLLNRAVLTDRLRERADLQVTHQHSIVACAIQTGFARNDPVAFLVTLEVEVTSSGSWRNGLTLICEVGRTGIAIA